MSERVINAIEAYYRRDGEKRSVLLNSKAELGNFRRNVEKNKRKFLGYRQVKLVEVK